MSHPRQTKESFMRKTIKTDSCWLWGAAICRTSGYGRCSLNGRVSNVHRVAYELFVGPVPKGLVLRHTCDNKTCVNPAHLRPGTQKQNIADRDKRGRTARGEQHGSAKISENTEHEIRRLSGEGLSQRKVASQFGISQRQVGRIVHGLSWRYLKRRHK